MCEKAIWPDIALLRCIFTRLWLVKVRPHTPAISSHIAFSPIKLYIYIYISIIETSWLPQSKVQLLSCLYKKHNKSWGTARTIGNITVYHYIIYAWMKHCTENMDNIYCTILSNDEGNFKLYVTISSMIVPVSRGNTHSPTDSVCCHDTDGHYRLQPSCSRKLGIKTMISALVGRPASPFHWQWWKQVVQYKLVLALSWNNRSLPSIRVAAVL